MLVWSHVKLEAAGPGGRVSCHHLLNDRELRSLEVLKTIYKSKTGRRMDRDANIFVFLGDSAENRKTWSFHSGKLPTYRRNSGLMWSPWANRWLTGREKLCSLGFPVTASASKSMFVPILPVRDTKRASLLAGNAMCFSTVGTVQLVALSCFKKR